MVSVGVKAQTAAQNSGNSKRRSEVTENTGGRDRDRTGDLLVANEALSQLSYSPIPSRWFSVVYLNHLASTIRAQIPFSVRGSLE
jgi:hypothetical protein